MVNVNSWLITTVNRIVELSKGLTSKKRLRNLKFSLMAVFCLYLLNALNSIGATLNQIQQDQQKVFAEQIVQSHKDNWQSRITAEHRSLLEELKSISDSQLRLLIEMKPFAFADGHVITDKTLIARYHTHLCDVLNVLDPIAGSYYEHATARQALKSHFHDLLTRNGRLLEPANAYFRKYNNSIGWSYLTAYVNDSNDLVH